MIFVENSFLPFSGYKLINLCGIIFCRSGVTKNMMKKELFMYNSKYKTNEIKNQKSVQDMG